MKKFALALQAVLVLAASPVYADTVTVKHHKEVDLGKFKCATGRSVLIPRVCYDKANSYMVIKVGDEYYHYCEIDPRTVRSLLRARSIDDYYLTSIRGHFDCRTHRVPNY